VQELIGPGIVNTMPEPTLRAFADHGRVTRTLDADPDAAERILREAGAAGIDPATVTAEREGVRAFSASFRDLLDCIESKLGAIVG
jgi:transaldolase